MNFEYLLSTSLTIPLVRIVKAKSVVFEGLGDGAKMLRSLSYNASKIPQLCAESSSTFASH